LGGINTKRAKEIGKMLKKKEESVKIKEKWTVR
jgi:hypothetical protein